MTLAATENSVQSSSRAGLEFLQLAADAHRMDAMWFNMHRNFPIGKACLKKYLPIGLNGTTNEQWPVNDPAHHE